MSIGKIISALRERAIEEGHASTSSKLTQEARNAARELDVCLTEEADRWLEKYFIEEGMWE